MKPAIVNLELTIEDVTTRNPNWKNWKHGWSIKVELLRLVFIYREFGYSLSFTGSKKC